MFIYLIKRAGANQQPARGCVGHDNNIGGPGLSSVIQFLEKADELIDIHPFLYVEIGRTHYGWMAAQNQGKGKFWRRAVNPMKFANRPPSWS